MDVLLCYLMIKKLTKSIREVPEKERGFFSGRGPTGKKNV